MATGPITPMRAYSLSSKEKLEQMFKNGVIIDETTSNYYAGLFADIYGPHPRSAGQASEDKKDIIWLLTKEFHTACLDGDAEKISSELKAIQKQIGALGTVLGYYLDCDNNRAALLSKILLGETHDKTSVLLELQKACYKASEAAQKIKREAYAKENKIYEIIEQTRSIIFQHVDPTTKQNQIKQLQSCLDALCKPYEKQVKKEADCAKILRIFCDLCQEGFSPYAKDAEWAYAKGAWVTNLGKGVNPKEAHKNFRALCPKDGKSFYFITRAMLGFDPEKTGSEPDPNGYAAYLNFLLLGGEKVVRPFGEILTTDCLLAVDPNLKSEAPGARALSNDEQVRRVETLLTLLNTQFTDDALAEALKTGGGSIWNPISILCLVRNKAVPPTHADDIIVLNLLGGYSDFKKPSVKDDIKEIITSFTKPTIPVCMMIKFLGEKVGLESEELRGMLHESFLKKLEKFTPTEEEFADAKAKFAQQYETLTAPILSGDIPTDPLHKRYKESYAQHVERTKKQMTEQDTWYNAQLDALPAFIEQLKQ